MRRQSKEAFIDNINIVLAHPQIPDNIGLVARALKASAFGNLCLVSPNLTEKAFAVAKSARDTLTSARVYKTLREAVASSGIVFGTTRRKRGNQFIYNFNAIKHLIAAAAARQRGSIVFGRASSGRLSA